VKNLTADKCREWIDIFSELEKDDAISIAGEAHLQAYRIALPILEQQERGDDSEDIFIVMRKPGCMPVIKRPVGEIEDYLSQLYSMNEGALCDVITYRYSGALGQWSQDGRELLKIAEMSMGQPTNQNGEQ